MNGRYEEREQILKAVTLCALSESHDGVLQILPRLSNTSIASILGDLGQPTLLSAAIAKGSYRYTTGDFLLRAYNSDLSARDASGANALILASKVTIRDTSGMTRRILEEREDLLNSQDFSGRTPLSWAAENATTSAEVLLDYKDIQLELADDQGLAPIDFLMRKRPNPSRQNILRLMVPMLEHGINRLDRHGCTLLHMLIDNCYNSDRCHEHWQNLERYEDRKIFELREEGWGDYRNPGHLQQALGVLSVTASQVRSSPCKCGIGTIFLAISTEDVSMVDVLLELYPGLVNDRFFDGSSPLDLANCIRDPNCRQSMIGLIRNPQWRQPMIDLVLSLNQIVETCKADTRTVGISESDSVEAQESSTDLRLQQKRGDHVEHGTGDQ